ncbi:LysR family transcriptional regulator [Pacificoceanicola onchidii]|uniref:LysR family transcriptional regulator n=1 Tax=Pacificoceanicola onchidii TaxID=2562685 RepID=UPI0010A695FA|nr:LysR family transcriptional regulator [Pacificoceanicola onchidii]
MLGRFSEMEVFVCVVDMQNFTNAGKALGLSPSAVSKIIARLEHRLGLPLAIRSTRRLRLTAEGEAYYLRAQEILAQVKRSEAEIVEGKGHVSGVLRVSSNVPFAIHKIAPLIPEFLETFPDLKLEFDYQDDQVDLIFERTDVAIRSGDLTDSSMMARRLMSSTRHIVASPDYLARYGSPQTPEDLLNHNCLGLAGRKRFSTWPFLKSDGVSTYALELSGNLYFNNGEALRDFALRGAGITRNSAFHIADDVAQGRLVPILEEFNPGDTEPMSAIYSSQSHVPLRIRAFIDFLTKNLPASAELTR